ncbi:MAG: hypothetical protein PUB03_01280, partial [bacterium]|nr:hypothetical protein [bacterium]
KLTIKNLKLNKKRTIVTIIGIMLSVALITAVASMYASGIKSLIKYETLIKGDFHTAFYNVPTSDIDLIAIDNEYEKEYKEALYKAQKIDDVSFLVDVFSKCQKRLDEKMIDYKNTIDLVKKEIESEDR